MKKYLIYLMMTAAVLIGCSCSPEEENGSGNQETEIPDIPEEPTIPDDGDDEGDNPEVPDTIVNTKTRTLVAYFSWSGTTQRMAQEIVRQTGADLFRIEPVNPYPTEYTPCTEVAREEKDNDARPAIAGRVENWEAYDTVFIGCPVWWWTTPMIICTFAESYDFSGKVVVPFCTYASTYRDETLARIVELTPAAEHLEGEGLTSGRINADIISAWLRRIGILK